MAGIISGAGIINSSPLISFNTFIDEDLSLMSYVITKIRNEKVFDLSRVTNMGITDLIKELYCRRYQNPLEFLMKDKIDKEFLDECYKEFMENGEYLYESAIGTDFFKVLESFKEAGDINVTILYHNDAEKYVLDKDPFLSTFEATDNPKHLQYFSQLYFRYIEDANGYIKDMTRKTYYFSSSVLNLNKDQDAFKDSVIIDYLVDMKNNISIFDMYKENVIGKVLY